MFKTWLLETYFIVMLKPGQIVVTDDAIFHQGGRIQKLIEAADCHLKYLLSYSPDQNTKLSDVGHG
nr:transposase [Nostoc punctiforme]